jgi:serine/threonine protein kinase
MSLRELRQSTKKLSESQQIGEGGPGSVYKGVLDGGMMVAITRSKHKGSKQNKEEFLSKGKVFPQIQHCNLVKILGELLYKDKTAVLVFAFISSSMLQKHLQGKHRTAPLSWKQRLNISIQTVDALNDC